MLNSEAGTIALVGAGEFLPPMAAIDQILMRRIAAEPHVAIIPTASAPDGDDVFNRWLQMGHEHFSQLGAIVTPVALKTRADAEDPTIVAQLAGAHFFYLSGGKPTYLRDILAGTAAWRTVVDNFSQGGVIAGCSAGAMVLGDRLLDFRSFGLTPGLGLLPDLAIVPHFDDIPLRIGGLVGRVLDLVAKEELTVVGIDGNTALIGTGGEWTVEGLGHATVFAHGKDNRYNSSERVPLRSWYSRPSSAA